MKILLHSNAPWVPSGYGQQAQLAGRILAGLGHGVSFSAFHGLQGQPIKWEGYAVYPSGQLPFGADMIVPHARMAGAELIVSIMDTYMLGPAAGQLRSCGIPFAPLAVIDCTAPDGGPGKADRMLLERSGALPAAVSRFGQARLEGLGPQGWQVPYVPHAVDTSVFRPPADRKALREEMGTADDFLIGIHGANRDGVRKSYPEQFAAFSRFSRKHKDARLAVFAVADSPGGLPLAEVASDMGILERTVFMPAYQQDAGLLSDEFVATWYASLDLLSICSYAEGFGIPALQAQACGTPVAATDCSAMTELASAAGWLVKGTRFWNAVHRAWWTRPDEDAIAKAWERAYQEGPSDERRARAAEFAAGYGLDVAAGHWERFLSQVQQWQEQQGNREEQAA